MYLLFFVARLRVEQRSKAAVIYLRYKAATDGCEGVDFNEQLLTAFCFPLGPEAVQPKEVQASEEYTFTLTHNDGQRFTGFCRQIFPPAPRVGSKARYPQVLCIVAENPWCNFFFKVLQIAEQILKGYEGLLDSMHQELPLDSQLGAFVVDLRKQLATNPAPGEVLRLAVPHLNGLQGVSPPRYLGAASASESLNWSDGRIELQVPPDCGNGKGNSGIPLARLLFHVPVEGMLTLIASLLLERRIVFVARSRDTVTAAVQAAQALIYPFKWHHIYLPILPRDLVDYLAAPMPFLVGLTSEMLPLIRHIPMSEVTTVDLDLQKVFPPAGSQYDDGRALPYGRQLGGALEAVFKTVRSPTEYESSPVITGVMQEYFVRLFGSYRRFIHEQAMEPILRSLSFMSNGVPLASARGAGGGRDSTRGGRDTRDSRGGMLHLRDGGDGGMSPQGGHSASRLHDEMLRGHGYYFDQPAFVAHRHSEAVRSFLNAMRHSQLYQMFIQERLEMAANGAIELPPCSITAGCSYGSRPRSAFSKSSSANNLVALEKASRCSTVTHGSGTGYLPDPITVHNSSAAGDRQPDSGAVPGPAPASTVDPFELRVSRYPEQRRLRREQLRSLAAEAAAPLGVGAGNNKLVGRLRRHRRTDSEDLPSQPQPFGPLHGGESMRRITTYPGIVDLSVATLNDPASYFAEWDMHEDDEAGSASPSPSPRGDRERMRSESCNSLQSADSGEAAAPTAATTAPAPAPCAPFTFGGRAGGTREREVGRDSTPLRRLSVPMLSTNAKSTYISLRGAPTNDSPVAADRASGPLPIVGPAPAAPPTGTAGTRMAAKVNQIFLSNGGNGEPEVSGMVLKGGVQVKTMPDGHRVYDGTLRDMMRMATTEVKNGLLSGLHNLASPLSSPRGKEKDVGRETAADRRARVQTSQQMQQPRQLMATLAATSPQQQLQQQHEQQQQPLLPHHHAHHGSSPLGMSSSSAGGAHLGSIPLPSMAPAPSTASTRDSGAGAAFGGGGGGAASSGGAGSAAAGGGSGPGPGAGSRPPAHSNPGAGSQRPEDSQQHNRLSSFMSNLKDKVAGAGNKALGILPTPTYKPQTTGEKAAKFKAQLTGGGGASLLAGADGKLKQPHAPQRPLSLTGAQPPLGLRSDGGLMGSSSFSVLPPPPTPLYGTPLYGTPLYGTPAAMSSPAAPGTPSEGLPPVEVSPFAPRAQPRAEFVRGFVVSHPTLSHGIAELAGGSGDATPPAALVPGSAATSAFWHSASSAHLPPPSDWDPFGVGSTAPATSATSYSAASTCTWSLPTANGGGRGAEGGSVAIGSTAASPFAISTHALAASGDGGNLAAAAAATAQAAGSSSCDASTADLLGLLSQSAVSGGSSSFAGTAAATVAGSGFTFDPFAASEQVVQVQGRLDSAGSNDFAAFASASSPRDFPGLSPRGSTPLVG